MDYSLFKIINDFADTYPITRVIAIVFAKYAIFVLPFGIFFLRKKWKPALAALFVSTAGAYLINACIGFLYFRSRPFVDHPVIQIIHKSAGDKSFPSDHTAIAFAIAMTFFFFDKRLGICALVLAMCIGIGRIGVGVHYPLDVFGGMIVGVCSAFAVHRLFFFNRNS